MRPVPTLGLFLVLIPAATAAEREAFVRADDVALLAGPGTGMPETARLRRGTRLRVNHEAGEYYAVQPPAGSVSWVRAGYVQFVPDRPGGPTVFPAAAVVEANGMAKLKPGKVGEAKPLGVERTALPDGTVLTVVGQRIEQDGLKWFPVASPEDDFRYVAKAAVELGAAVESKFVVTSPNSGPVTPVSGTSPVASIPGSPPPQGGNWNHATWVEAQRAERAGEWDRAERLYLDLAKEMNQPGGTEKLAEDCYARVHDIREKRRKAGGKQSQAPRVADPLPRGERESLTVATTSPTGRTAVAKEPDGPRWEGPGTLYPSALRQNGEKLYALQSATHAVITYATPGPGVDLSKETGRGVTLYGSVTPLAGYPGKTVMTVSKVESR